MRKKVTTTIYITHEQNDQLKALNEKVDRILDILGALEVVDGEMEGDEDEDEDAEEEEGGEGEEKASEGEKKAVSRKKAKA